MDEVMVCRLLAQMSKMWPEEAAAARPDLHAVRSVKEPAQVPLCDCLPDDNYNPREFLRRHG